MHEHNHRCTCEHNRVQYCKHCHVCHCLDCSAEWSAKVSWYPWTYTTSNPGLYGSGSATRTVDLPATNTVLTTTCNHKE